MQTKSITWASVKRNVKDIIPLSYSPKTMTESERRNLEDSIREFGTAVPLVCNVGTRKNILINGHQRLKIYVDLGIDTVDVMVPSRELSDREERALNLRLSKNVGSWDEKLLKELDMDLLLEVGFDDTDLQALFDDVDVVGDDFDVEKALKEAKIPRVKLGEVWQLGEHRLLVGDSTDMDQVKKLMGDDLADVVYSDPIYNIGLDYSTGVGTKGKYEGALTGKKDSKKDAVYRAFIGASMASALAVAKPDAHLFYWCDSRYVGLIQGLYQEHSVDSKRTCLWIKNNSNMTPQVAWNKMYEPCVYGVRGGRF